MRVMASARLIVFNWGFFLCVGNSLVSQMGKPERFTAPTGFMLAPLALAAGHRVVRAREENQSSAIAFRAIHGLAMTQPKQIGFPLQTPRPSTPPWVCRRALYSGRTLVTYSLKAGYFCASAFQSGLRRYLRRRQSLSGLPLEAKSEAAFPRNKARSHGSEALDGLYSLYGYRCPTALESLFLQTYWLHTNSIDSVAHLRGVYLADLTSGR